MAFGARLVWMLVVASVLASGTVACSHEGITRAELMGRYVGHWSAGDRGTLILSPDGSYSWMPDAEGGSSKRRQGTFELDRRTDGQWYVTFKDSSTPSLQGAPFVILFGRVRSIEISEDHFLGKE
jgi:hypothetical protein